MERSRRNRRQNRRIWPNDIQRPVKRLFTPEIKRMLKDWLIRRRENPYPSREEKKALAVEAGLTYTQICNWFANWRRKLKNSSRERSRRTWGNLIKNYNENAKGNVEQFSISSDDSIWGEMEGFDEFNFEDSPPEPPRKKKKYMKKSERKLAPPSASFYAPSPVFQSLSSDAVSLESAPKVYSPTPKFKSHIMEKYLKGLEDGYDGNNNRVRENGTPQLSKWIESAAKFTPSKSSYIEWDSKMDESKTNPLEIHEKEEIEAAEALTKLAINFKNRLSS